MENNRVQRFIREPKKAMYRLAWPVVVGMLVQVLYNITDTAFVGRLGADAIAALTFSFPLFFLMIAINSGIGIGMGSRISRMLGAKRESEAKNTALHGILISLVFAALVLVGGLLTLNPVFRLFGANNTVLPLAISYMGIIFMGSFFIFPSYVINSIFTAQGDTKTPVRVQIISLVLNIILDPIFIYPLGFGVSGAAIASVISFALGLGLFIYYLRKKSLFSIDFGSFRLSWNIIKSIFRVGAPASMMMILMSVYIMFINRFMAHFSTNHVAAFGIASRLESLAVMPIVAMSVALLTLVGMFYGAKEYKKLKYIIWYGIKVNVLFTSLIGLMFFIAPGIFLRIFTPDQTLLSIGSSYMRIEVFTFPLMAVAMSSSRVLQGMGYGLPGFIINLTRIVFVAVPLAYVFVYIIGYGYLSIPVAMVTGGVASNIVALTWLTNRLGKLG